MKTASRLFLALALALGLSALTARANIGQSVNVNNAGSSVIVVPGQGAQFITIQNNGSGAVRLSFDGGAGFIDPNTGKPGTNPTPTKGILLQAGQQVTVTMLPYTSNQTGAGLHKPIVAILVNATTTTLDLSSDDTLTQFPTS